jgi:hypothetical protein
LATWQYGLGRSAAWTSDLKGQWGTEWVAWDEFPRFAAQLVSWTLPAPQVEGLSAQAWLEDDGAVIQVEATETELPGSGDTNTAGRPRDFLDVTATLIGPNLETIDAQLTQVGAGRYEARVDLDQPGAYLVRLAASEEGEALGQSTLGLVVPYSPEYRAGGTDSALLNQLARLTGGGQLPEPAAAFTHNLPAADRAREFWVPLLLIAALLFPLDVALRRVMLGPRDLRHGVTWLRERLPARPQVDVERERTLGRLFEARDRVRGRRPGVHAKVPPPRPSESPSPPLTEEAEPAPPATPPSSEDALVRLREAKKRARRDR